MHTGERKMNKAVSKIMLALLLIGMFMLAFNIQLMKVEPTPSASSGYHWRGATIVAWDASDYSTSDFDKSIQNLKDVGANWVGFTQFYFMENRTSSTIEECYESYTSYDAALEHAISVAHDLRLKVALRPIVDIKFPEEGDWRGNIAPTNRNLWYASYRDYINHYAEFAQNHDVELFAIGTELNSMQGDLTEWTHIINNVTQRYHGSITYSASWDRYGVDYVGFWNDLDFIGVDAYFPLTDSNNPSVEGLKNAWLSSSATGYVGRKWIDELQGNASLVGKKVIFTEIGYVSQDGTNTQPWNYTLSDTVDLQEQADCYQAALEIFKDKTWFQGWFWWNWETDPNAGKPQDPDTYAGYTPQNKPAQDILHTYYARTTVYADPHTIMDKVIGETVTVDINVSDVNDLYGWQAGMTFNPNVLSCTGYYEGEFLKRIGEPTFWLLQTPPWDNTKGIVYFPGCCLLGAAWGVSGSGQLGYLTFEVVGTGFSDLHLIDVILVNSNEQEIQHEVLDFFTVSEGGVDYSVEATSDVTGGDDPLTSGLVNHTFSRGEKSVTFDLITACDTFCYVEIPKTLLSCNNASDWTVEIDEELVPFEVTESPSYTYLYFTYHNSTHKVRITGTAVFRGVLLGDVNYDGTVNILDAIRLAGAFGSEPGQPNWNSAADINNDDNINILDAIILAGHFGETV